MGVCAHSLLSHICWLFVDQTRSWVGVGRVARVSLSWQHALTNNNNDSKLMSVLRAAEYALTHLCTCIIRAHTQPTTPKSTYIRCYLMLYNSFIETNTAFPTCANRIAKLSTFDEPIVGGHELPFSKSVT